MDEPEHQHEPAPQAERPLPGALRGRIRMAWYYAATGLICSAMIWPNVASATDRS